jgi:hypothetical protein
MESKLNIKLLKNILLSCMSLYIMISIISCSDELTEQEQAMAFVGTWKQTARTIDGVPSTIDSTRLVIEIDSINICILYDSSYTAVISDDVITRSGWSYTNGLFNIAVDLPASYTVEAGNDELTMERTDFAQDGSISKSSLYYQRIDQE